MKLKQISGEGNVSYLQYSSDTIYEEDLNRVERQDKNYYRRLAYRRKDTNDFNQFAYDKAYFNKPGKVRGVW